MAAQKTHAGSTQKFTEIVDIVEDIAVLSGGYATLVIEVQASNFALLSRQEQDAKIFAYAALLNSLSFPIQIIIRNKEVDISSYLQALDQEYQKVSSNPQANGLAGHMRLYRDFIHELITVNTVLDKKFYIVIPYSYLEKGVSGVSKTSGNDFVTGAKASLHSKADAMLQQLSRLNLRAKTLEKEELVKLFYDIYNHGQTAGQAETSIKTPVIKGSV
jgi:hypothetical protein